MRPAEEPGADTSPVDATETIASQLVEAPTVAPDSVGLVHGSSTVALLRLYGSILDELLRRGIVRSRNAPIGDVAEYLAAIVYRGQLAPPSAKSWDVRAEDGRLLQVKCRVVRPKQTGNYSFLRSWEFDACVFVELDSASYGVLSAVEVPRAGVESLARASAHVNGSRIRLTDDLRKIAGAADRTADFQQAFETMDQTVQPTQDFAPRATTTG